MNKYGVKGKTGTGRKEALRGLSEAEISLFKKELKARKLFHGTALEIEDRRLYVLFILGISSPFSVKELLKLKIKDLLDDKGKLKGYLSKELKDGSMVKVVLTDELKTLLHSYITHDVSGCDYLFPAIEKETKHYSRKKAITPESVNRILREIGKELNLTGIGNATLIKTYGIRMLKHTDNNIELVQRLLEQQNINTLFSFLQVSKEDYKKDIIIDCL